MSYRIIIPKLVQKQLNSLPQKERERILEAIKNLVNIPRPNGVKKLKGHEQNYRIRVGNYRVIYQIKDQEMIVLILSAVHRKDAY